MKTITNIANITDNSGDSITIYSNAVQTFIRPLNDYRIIVYDKNIYIYGYDYRCRNCCNGFDCCDCYECYNNFFCC